MPLSPSQATRKTKVVHIISGDLWAGAEVMTFNLLRRLTEFDDLEISAILLNEGKLAENLRDLGMRVHVFDEKEFSFYDLLRNIRKIINIERPDIAHSHRYKEHFLSFLGSRSNTRTRLIATQHGLPETSHSKMSFKARVTTTAYFYLLSRYFTKTVAVSGDIRNYLLHQRGFKSESLEVIHNGVETPLATQTGSKPGQFVIGSSGRLFPVKDYPLMVEIARCMAARCPDGFRFELAGDGPGYATLNNMIDQYQLRSCFSLLGHLDDMDTFYRGLNLYLNTSIHEGIPMTILEALSYGLPVVAPAVGGIVEVIENGREGFLVTSREPSEFAEKCTYLKQDRNTYLNMSEAARNKAVREFSAAAMASRYHSLYKHSHA